MMVRPKKGKDPKQRLLEIFDNPVSINSLVFRVICIVTVGSCEFSFTQIRRECEYDRMSV